MVKCTYNFQTKEVIILKKILAAILSLGIVGGTLPAAYPFTAGQSSAEDFFDPLTKIGLPLENYPERLLGDADNDKLITPYDASKVLRVYAEASVPSCLKKSSRARCSAERRASIYC